MKKVISMLLALFLIAALFCGCGNGNSGSAGGNSGSADAGTNAGTSAGANTGTGSGSAPSTDGGQSNTGSTSDGGQETEESPYRLAYGKFTKNAEGWSDSAYVYELPLSTTDEVFTDMTLNWLPQYIPEEGYAGLPVYAGAEQMTGVHIEYEIVSSATYDSTLAVKEASDDLNDIIGGFSTYHAGATLTACIDDGFIVNVHDWLDYLPNYGYRVRQYQKLDAFWGKVNTPTDEKWCDFVSIYYSPMQSTGYFLRQDWLDTLGLGEAEDVQTYDQFYEILKAFKTNYTQAYPMMVFDIFEREPYCWTGYNTTPMFDSITFKRVKDGKVMFTGTDADDLALMQLLNKWYAEGLIDPNYGSYDYTTNMSDVISNNMLGAIILNPGEVVGFEQSSTDPNCEFSPVQRLRQSTDQILHWHLDSDAIGGSGCSVSARCENLPLLMTYIDWLYSEEGVFWMNYGPQGEYWDYDASGAIQWLEPMLSFDMGVAWATMTFLYCPNDAGMNVWTRNYHYEGGDRLLHFFDIWADSAAFYDGAYNYPSAIKLTDEDEAEVNNLKGDAQTFFEENYVQFFNGSKSFSEWDAFQAELGSMGLNRITEIYQEYYDAYIGA